MGGAASMCVRFRRLQRRHQPDFLSGGKTTNENVIRERGRRYSGELVQFLLRRLRISNLMQDFVIRYLLRQGHEPLFADQNKCCYLARLLLVTHERRIDARDLVTRIPPNFPPTNCLRVISDCLYMFSSCA